MKKVVSLILSLLMMFSIATSAMAAPSKELLSQDNEQRTDLTKVTKLKADVRAEGLKDSDQVRVIVELSGKPAIEYATEKGVKVTQLDKSYLKSITDGITIEQKRVKQQITSNRIAVKYHYSFSNVANGFSATVTYGDAKKIESLPGVVRVVIANEYERPEPNLDNSSDMVKAIETWNLGYNGEGMVVSIIDTGIDYDHKDMRLTDSSKEKLNKSLVNSIVLANGLKGKWYTDKVPYGYNYYDNNDTVKDLGSGASMHGMHVAGIAGANGIGEASVKGVAPEAQLLALKVFSNNQSIGSTYSDIYLAAIEDSIKLGVDAINMSLGATAGFQRPEDPEQVALTKATRNGIVLAISAGNSGNIGYGYYHPYAKNPDIGVVGTPGLNNDSIQVASIENTNITAYTFEYVYTDGLVKGVPYMDAGPNIFDVMKMQKVKYIDCGLGGLDSEFPAEVAGNIALIKRGSYDFTVKISNAQEHGAAGVIVYNHEAGGEELISMKYPQTCTIPAIFIPNSHGAKLLQLISTGGNFVEFKGNTTLVSNPKAGSMSDFTSWGTTPNLDFKPELTAPGGSIFSTFNDNKYGLMSGTSMAAPHVAGGSALILQRVDKEFGLTGYSRSLMAKNLLLSTADPIMGSYDTLVSPRVQGAGVMNLQAAAKTPAIIIDNSTGISKVNLKEIGNTRSFKLKVTNFSNNPVSYNLSGTVETDLMVHNNETGEDFIYEEAQGVFKAGTIDSSTWLGEYPIAFAKDGVPVTSITVPANSSTVFAATIDLSNAVDWLYNAPIKSLFKNGAFIEGFIKLESADDTQPTIGIPYMGFYGKWDKAPIIDDNNYDPKAQPFYGYITTLAWLNRTEETYYFLGHDFDDKADANNIAFSPNGDGIADHAVFLGTFLRNAKELEINILDKNHNQIRTLAMNSDITKNFYNSGEGAIYTSDDTWEWDGTVSTVKVPDGEYIYQIKAKIDYPNARWQTVEFPVKVDTQAPVFETFEYDLLTKQLTALAKDNHNVKYYELIKDGATKASNSTGKFDVTPFISPYGNNIFVLRAHDFAENIVERDFTITEAIDKEAPAIFIDRPEDLKIYNSREVVTSGYLTDNSQIKELKINNEVVTTLFDETTKRYAFEKTLNIPHDGSFIIKYEATDIYGNSTSMERKIYVDTAAPVINLAVPETVAPDVDKLQLTGTVTDNMPGLKVIVNGNVVYQNNVSNIEGEPTAYYDFTGCAPVDLAYGDNTITIEASDAAGNVSMKQYTVHRLNEVPMKIESASVSQQQYVTAKNPVVISAEANYAVNWEVKVINSRGIVVKTFIQEGSKTFNSTWIPSRYEAPDKFRVEFKAVKGNETQTTTIAVTILSSR